MNFRLVNFAHVYKLFFIKYEPESIIYLHVKIIKSGNTVLISYRIKTLKKPQKDKTSQYQFVICFLLCSNEFRLDDFL